MNKILSILALVATLFAGCKKESNWVSSSTGSPAIAGPPLPVSVTRFTDTFRLSFVEKVKLIDELKNVIVTFKDTSSTILIKAQYAPLGSPFLPRTEYEVKEWLKEELQKRTGTYYYGDYNLFSSILRSVY